MLTISLKKLRKSDESSKNNAKTVEHFKACSTSIPWEIYLIVYSISWVIAIALSFKRNNGFNFGSFLVACCCPWIYIIYYIVTSRGYKCKKIKS